MYAVRCNGEKVQFIDQYNKVIEYDKDGDTITNGKVHYTRVR